ncbi:MAG TPA: POTRA domain-containing protein [Methylophilus sp.]
MACVQAAEAEESTPVEGTDYAAALVTQAEDTLRFNVYEFQVDGNSVLNPAEIEKTVYPFMGEAKTIQDVEQARTALEKTYQDAGYLTVSVTIPQQEVNAGLVRLLVTEGRVERLRVVDSQYNTLSEIKSRTQAFAEGTVPHFPTAQKELATLNRNQNRQVNPVLRPGKTPGKLEVDLQVKDKLPLHGSLELNDRYSPNTSHLRLNGSVRYENLFQKDHSLALNVQVSPQDLNQVKVFSGTYIIPRMNGDYFAAYAVVSDSNIAAVGDVNVVGNGYILGTRYIMPLPLSEGFYHSLTLGADYKMFKETLTLGSDTNFNTPISYFTASAGYDATLQSTLGQTQGTVTLNMAPRLMGNTSKEFDRKRDGAEANYVYLRADAKHLFSFDSGWALQGKLAWQLSSQPLISTEQFTIGGVESVRGYLESSRLGDSGVSASVEARTPQLTRYFKDARYADYIKDFYAFTFVDAGRVNVRNAAGLEPYYELYSAGLGAKLKTNLGWYAFLDYAQALNDAPEVKQGDYRLHFRLGYEW